MTRRELRVSVPARYQEGKSSKERMGGLLQISAYQPPSDFDPDIVSWVTPNVAVTDWEGGVRAKQDGDFVICVAGEMPELGHVWMPIDPDDGRRETLKMLNRIAELIDWVVSKADKSVVVHCAMGIERSVLAVAWYLHRYQQMSLDEAYDIVGDVRPIAADRKYWVTSA